MGACRNFRREMGACPKQSSHTKKVMKRLPHGDKYPHNEKNIAKRPYIEKRWQKGLYSKKNPDFIGGRAPTLGHPLCGCSCTSLLCVKKSQLDLFYPIM